MKISCLQENLAKALSIVNRAVASRTTLPITQNVLLATDNGRLKLSTTDLTISLTTWIGARVEVEGAVTVPARLLSDFVASLPPERIDMEIVDKPLGVHLFCNGTSTNISGSPAADFPPIPQVEGGVTGKIAADVLRTAVNQVAYAAATDDSRPVLTGVRLEVTDQDFTMAAADGFRLAVHNGKLEAPIPGNPSVTIPAKALSEVNRLLSSQEDPVEFLISPVSKQMMFRLSTTEMVSTLIDGNFPNYNQLIPQSSGCKVTVQSKDLLRATRTAGVFARSAGGNGGVIRMELEAGEDSKGGCIKVSSQSEEIGDSEGVVAAMLEGDSNKIAFNFKYLSDTLEALSDDTVILETDGPSSPGVLKPGDSSGTLVVIMPVYVQWA